MVLGLTGCACEGPHYGSTGSIWHSTAQGLKHNRPSKRSWVCFQPPVGEEEGGSEKSQLPAQ